MSVSDSTVRILRSKKRRGLHLRFESLEDRVVFNAVNPVTAPLAQVPESSGVESAIVDPIADHAPGCSCLECIKIVTGEGSEQRTAWAIPAIYDDPEGSGPRDPEPAPPYPGQTFTLHSRPSATKKIYLDFNGHTTSGTGWNSSFNNNQPFTSGAFNFEGSNSSFTINEEERIQKIWQRVMEDFSPFDVDVTTEDPGLSGLTYSGGGDNTWGMRVVISPDDGWIRDNVGGIGGIAYVPSFKSSIDITCYVFSGNLGPNNEKFVAEAISHEVGHTLGLDHDGNASQEYDPGHAGAGTPGWAPIMGVGYSQPLTQWSKGEYAGANNTENDLSIITNTTENFGYRPDDAGNSIATATPATVVGTSLSFSGVIERTTDVDVISFYTGTGSITLNLNPWVNSPNLDIKAELRDSSGTMIGAAADPLSTLSASLTRTITVPGTYYLFIDGVGVGNASTTGYSDYASLGQYTVTGTIISVERLSNIESSSLTYTENQSAIALTSEIIISAGNNLNQATVAIGNYANGQDSLLFTNQAGISGNFNTSSGILTLSGTASPSAYQTALRSVTYVNSSENPSTATRTLTFQLRDITNNLTNSLQRDMNVISVNDQPTLNAIGNVSFDEDSSGLTVNLGGISDGGGEGQTLTVTATSDNPAVVPNPGVSYSSPSGTGSLNVVPATNRSGTATITVTVSDGGGTANGGIQSVSRTFTVDVNPINDAPIFTKGSDPYSPLLGGDQTILNWATNISAGAPDESGQSLTFTVSNDANALFLVQPTLSSDGTLTFTPVPGAIGIANASVFLQDNGGTANGGFDTSGTQNFVLNVGYNRAPTLDDSTSPLLTPVAQSSVSPIPNTVASFTSSYIADPDPGSPLGIAVIGADSSKGGWQYSVDGGLNWQPLGNVNFNSAKLLRNEDLIRYIPTSGQMGKATISYHAWDQSTGSAGGTADLGQGTGGQSSFSTLAESATVRVAAAVTTIVEDGRSPGKKLTVLPASTFSDPDLKPKRGVAIIGAGGQIDGTWQYSARGRGWKAFDAFDPASALLLRSNDKVRFVPAANAFGEAYLIYRAWDQSSGTAGTTVDLTDPNSFGGSTAFSNGTDYMFAVVKEVNDRPLIDKGAAIGLTPVDPADADPDGNSVAEVLGSVVTDQDAGTVPGIAVTRIKNTGGIWQYQLAGSGNWTDVPKVSSRLALLLGENDRLRFLPDGTTQGTVALKLKAWDQTSGTPGTLVKTNTSAFSKKAGTANVEVTVAGSASPNTAPTLNVTPNVTFSAIDEDTKSLGNLVSSLLGTAVTDPDAGALQGIAVTGLTGTSTGVWQYSKNGKGWKSIPSVSDEVALLLSETDRIRYLPKLNFNGTASLSYHAWDQSQGTPFQYANLSAPDAVGGSGAFSVAEETATLTVNPVNDRPILSTRPTPVLTSIEPGDPNPIGTSVASLLGSAMTDVDAGSLQGIAVTKIPPVLGEWQFRLAGQPGWNALAGTNSGQAILLRPTDFVRFLPLPQFQGTASISYRGWDQSLGTAGTVALTSNNDSLSKATENAKIVVGSANFRPILDAKPVVTLPPVPLNATNPPGYLVSSLLGSAVTDADNGALSGIAIVKLASKNGQWQYAIDGGQWLTLDSFSGVSLLLKSTDKIRFVPNAGFAGSATIKYKAWDQSEGVAGNFVKPTSDALSKATETATVSVNTAPSLTW